MTTIALDRMIIRMGSMASSAAVVLVVASVLMAPLPVPALTTTVGALGASWLTRRRKAVFASIGVVAGLLIGTVLHYRMHAAEDRLLEGAAMGWHLAADAGIGMASAAVAISAAFGVRTLIRRHGRCA